MNINEDDRSTKEVCKQAIKTSWRFILIIAILMLIGGSWLGYYTNNAVDKGIWICCGGVVAMCLTTLGSIILTSAVGTFILKNTGLISWMRSEVAQIMTTNKFIALLNSDQIEELKKALNERIYSKKVASDASSLLNTVNQAIDPYIEQYYFDEYSIVFACKIKKDRIEKTVTRNMRIKPARVGKLMKVDLGELCSATFKESEMVKDSQDTPAISLSEFSIDGKQFTDIRFKQQKLKKGECNEYKYSLHSDSTELNKKLQLKKESGIKIKIVTKTTTGLDDNLLVHKLPAACKKYTAQFQYKEEQCKVNCAPFGFFDAHIEGKCDMDAISDDSIQIAFNDWILPSDGVAFALRYKIQ